MEGTETTHGDGASHREVRTGCPYCGVGCGLVAGVADGKPEIVRRYRLEFQETVAPSATGAVEQITGRKVVGYHSQIVFHPTRAFEIFVLAPER